MRHNFLIALAVAATLAAASPGIAATVTGQTTADLNAGTFSPDGTKLSFGGNDIAPISLTLNQGDTLDFTIDFLGDQRLSVGGLDRLQLYLNIGQPGGGTATSSNRQLFLLGSGGETIFTTSSNTLAQTNGAIFGALFFADDLVTVTSPLIFSGVRIVLPVSYDDGLPRTYQFASLSMTGLSDDFEILSSATPEPSTWAMLIIGFGAVGAMTRRRRAIIA